MFWFMHDWGAYGRAYEKIAEHLSQLAAVRRVVCVLPPLEGDPGRWTAPLKFFHVSRRLLVLCQRTAVAPLHGPGYRPRTWLNERLPDLALRAFLTTIGIRAANTLLWLYPPHAGIAKLRRLVPHAHTVVQIVDNNALIETASGRWRDANARQYEGLAREADCVVVSSEANLGIFLPLNPKCLLFENAVDERFIRRVSELPCRTSAVRPRLGYVGFISERTDIGLLESLARARPQYDLLIAGPDKSGTLGPLLKYPNVKWLGPVPYDRLPDLVASFDVCLIPHRDTPYSRTMSPLKLFQYLGSGRPIVSTEIAGVERWRDLIAVAADPEDFVALVDAALRSETTETAAARIAAASRETWRHRVGEMYGQIVKALQAEGSGA